MTENKTVYNTINAEQLFEEGRLYYNGIYGGREVTKDFDHALKCFYEAALLGHEYALERYAQLKVYIEHPTLFHNDSLIPKDENIATCEHLYETACYEVKVKTKPESPTLASLKGELEALLKKIELSEKTDTVRE